MNDLVMSIKHQLAHKGFCHIPGLLVSGEPRAEFLKLATSLGQPVVPDGCSTEWPVIETRPSTEASIRRPFDRAEAIGWHNDFTTHRWRPRWTVMWSVQPDPAGGTFGAWRVARVADVLDDPLLRNDANRRALEQRVYPFGYSFEGYARRFKILYSSRGPGLRFNGKALIEGSVLARGSIDSTTLSIVDGIRRAADRHSFTFPAGRGDILITDNWLSLHDRLELSVGDGSFARKACLCFINEESVKQRGRTDPRGSKWN